MNHGALVDDMVEETLEYNPIEYKVEVYVGEIDPINTHRTWGNWYIEGNFIIVYDRNGLKYAYALPDGITMIKTVEMPGEASYVLDDVDLVINEPTKEIDVVDTESKGGTEDDDVAVGETEGA